MYRKCNWAEFIFVFFFLKRTVITRIFLRNEFFPFDKGGKNPNATRLPSLKLLILEEISLKENQSNFPHPFIPREYSVSLVPDCHGGDDGVDKASKICFGTSELLKPYQVSIKSCSSLRVVWGVLTCLAFYCSYIILGSLWKQKIICITDVWVLFWLILYPVD